MPRSVGYQSVPSFTYWQQDSPPFSCPENLHKPKNTDFFLFLFFTFFTSHRSSLIVLLFTISFLPVFHHSSLPEYNISPVRQTNIWRKKKKQTKIPGAWATHRYPFATATQRGKIIASYFNTLPPLSYLRSSYTLHWIWMRFCIITKWMWGNLSRNIGAQAYWPFIGFHTTCIMQGQRFVTYMSYVTCVSVSGWLKFFKKKYLKDSIFQRGCFYLFFYIFLLKLMFSSGFSFKGGESGTYQNFKWGSSLLFLNA